jgi:hypothetical protein
LQATALAWRDPWRAGFCRRRRRQRCATMRRACPAIKGSHIP